MDTPKRWELDNEDAEAAHALEAQALAALLTLEDGQATLDRALADSPRVKGPTRAGAANALRGAAKKLGCRPALALLKAADERYWAMVLRHDPLIREKTGKAAQDTRGGLRPLRPGSEEWEDLYQLQRIGWYRAALRYDPSRGFRFITMAVHWGNAYCATHRDRAVVKIAPDKHTGVFEVARVVSLEDPIPGTDDDLTIGDTIEDVATVGIDLDELLTDRVLADRVRAAIEAMHPQVQRVMSAIYLRGSDSYIEIASAMGERVDRVRQLEEVGLSALRDTLDLEVTERSPTWPWKPEERVDDGLALGGEQVGLFSRVA